MQVILRTAPALALLALLLMTSIAMAQALPAPLQNGAIPNDTIPNGANPDNTIKVCPGSFPTDLTSVDCRYTPRMRSLDYVTGSVTDQTVLGAVVFGLGAQIIQSPPEWKRTWYGYGQRVGARYTQALGKGTAQYLVGLMCNDDPRFVAYRDEPAVIGRQTQAVKDLSLASSPNTSMNSVQHDGWRRFGHAWFDTVTVRRSNIHGNGRRIPAFSRFAGDFAGAYAGYPWYPRAENTLPQVGVRVAGSFGTSALSSFYNEYNPEITRLLGSIFRRGGQPKSVKAATP